MICSMSRSLLALSISAALTAQAEAAPVTFTVSSSGGGTYLGGSANASFDVSGILAGYTNPTITGANVIAYFADNQDSPTVSTRYGSYGYSYTDTSECNGNRCNYNWHYIYTRDVTTSNYDAAEAFSLSVEGQAGFQAASTSYYTNSVYVSRGFDSAQYNINSYNDDNYYYSNYYNNRYGYGGNASTSFNLLDSTTASVFADGSVNIGLSTLSGDGYFSSASMTFTIDDAPVISSEAPEPGSLALVGIALFGLARRSRRSRK